MRQIALLLALILGAGLAQAQDVPKRKSGLWEIKVQSFRKEGVRTTQMCVDQKTDDAVRQLVEARGHESCKKVTLRREGDKQLFDAECKLSGRETTAKTHGVITGSFDSAYKIESTLTFSEPVHGKSEGSAVIEARWIGPCQSDQKPGDVILANGKKFNIDEPKDLKPRQGLSSAPTHKPRKPVPTQ